LDREKVPAVYHYTLQRHVTQSAGSSQRNATILKVQLRNGEPFQTATKVSETLEFVDYDQ
jgi:hypothetical protein